jgi:hypothetical protein
LATLARSDRIYDIVGKITNTSLGVRLTVERN